MTPAAPAVGFVSDDLTGGLLVASYFEEAGLACPVILGAEAAAAEPPRAPLAVVATRARLAPVAQALEETGRAFDALEATLDPRLPALFHTLSDDANDLVRGRAVLALTRLDDPLAPHTTPLRPELTRGERAQSR